MDKEDVVQTIYEKQRYEIPYSEMASWIAYVKDLSYFVQDSGNLQTAFSDKFSKYLKQSNINTDYIGQECFFIDNVTHSKKFDGRSLGKSIKEGVHFLHNLPIIWFENPFLGFNWQYKRNVRF